MYVGMCVNAVQLVMGGIATYVGIRNRYYCEYSSPASVAS